ncbi:UDP-N-acetylglucosamine 2-epimerase (hydrolyzing) [Leptospira sp. 201903075]|uniref:UDP-N-acetylglucosamine 2-epimerase n=1 Tax=Leptospira chreensis TaxID=2810035 RepID=UPI00196632C7|nr:UDP-N-acetylglucosamine 2-epimerase [Leptospira chreensis]MBM9589076.1 UDP-N-acetylglucosamine 2-epimerase (hydrolyzing) [Leptospira chreensis]
MNPNREKICIVTGTRAEYGLLKNLFFLFKDSERFHLQIIATGMHLSPEFGLTYKEIEADGLTIDKKVEMLLSSDTPSAIAKSMGLATIGFADALVDLKPDLLIVLGDRYEILAAVSAALPFQIPIVHIHGGEKTEGVIDEAIRHSITKMSLYHFVATEEYKNRVIQLGENPGRVFVSGGLGVDLIKSLTLFGKEELENRIQYKFHSKNILVTFHPVTLELNSSELQFKEILLAVSQFLENNDAGVIFTKANSDTNGRVINRMIDEFVSKNSRSVSFTSMGQLNYFSALQFVDLVLGNSSSGLLEVPTFGKTSINVGDRQKGRLQAASVIQAEPTSKSVGEAINRAYSEEFSRSLENVKNPYGNGGASEFIFKTISSFDFTGMEIKKEFFDIKVENQ